MKNLFAALALIGLGARVIGCDLVEAGLAETKPAIEKAGFKADYVTADSRRSR